jgi:hypothetical protein
MPRGLMFALKSIGATTLDRNRFRYFQKRACGMRNARRLAIDQSQLSM